MTLDDVACVGVSAPGPIDAAGERLLYPPNLPGWGDVPVRRILADALGVPVHVENDANAAVLAEWRFGAGRGFDDVVYLTASTGIGAGVVLGGRLQRGHAGNAGEIGHAPVEWDGLPCVCGQRGCLEAYVGGAAWTRRLQAITPETSAVARIAGGVEHARPEHVVAAAGEGDAFAHSEMERFNRYLARAIVTLVFVLAPEVETALLMPGQVVTMQVGLGGPGMGKKSTCPWDCAQPPDGVVSAADLLALLATWGLPGPCDFDGSGAIGTADLLKLLTAWGMCP